MKFALRPIIVLLLLASVGSQAQMLAPGDPAPDFTLPFATKDSVSRTPLTLSAVASQTIVLLAFYPADWSSGCTKEVCSLRDDIETLADLGIEVLAISGDYVYSHHAWAKHHGLPFRLLSDHRHEVARAYGTFDEGTGFTKRSVFIVGRDMHLLYADLEYSVRDDEDYNSLKQALGRTE